MEWWGILLIILGSLLGLMIAGLPVAFCFMVINIIGAALLMGGTAGLQQMTLSIFSSVSSFSFLPIPLFILMGEVLFHSGIAQFMINALDNWMGRVPGRLALLAVGAGTLFSTLTGSSLGSAAILGSSLAPEMAKRGYKNSMNYGPIIGSGGLAIMIPPSALAVFLAAVAEISIAEVLMAIIIPGVIMALLYCSYILIRCLIQPSIAPPYQLTEPQLSEKIKATIYYILPISLIIFLVIGLILLGIASPTEAAGSGVLGSFALTALYRKFNWKLVKKSLSSSMIINSMIFLIMIGARAYGEILAFSGSSRSLVLFVKNLPFEPIVIIIAFQIVLLILGMFMSASAIIMIAAPLIFPIVNAIGFSPVWYSVLFMLALEMGASSPPFGAINFVVKGVAEPGVSLADIYKAGLPFLACDTVAMILIIIFPDLALWVTRMI